MVIPMATANAQTTVEFVNISTLSIGDYGDGWIFGYDVFTNALRILDGANIEITGSVSNGRHIIIAEDATANITLNNVSITGLRNVQPPFNLRNNANVYLTLIGDNVLTAWNNTAAISVDSGRTLTISAESTGSLIATGGTDSIAGGGGAGIGIPSSVSHTTTGTIIINGGNITAIGGGNAAGIGGGGSRNGTAGSIGNLTINGGNVIAIGSGNGAGIGGGGSTEPLGSWVATGGSGGNIAINGGTVNATSGGNGAGIGGGGTYNGVGGAGGNIIINGSIVSATSYGNTFDFGAGRVDTGTQGAIGVLNMKGNAIIVGRVPSTSTLTSVIIFDYKVEPPLTSIGKIYGNFIIDRDSEINYKTIIIQENSTLTVAGNAVLTNNNTIKICGTLIVRGALKNDGTIIICDTGKLKNNGQILNFEYGIIEDNYDSFYGRNPIDFPKDEPIIIAVLPNQQTETVRVLLNIPSNQEAFLVVAFFGGQSNRMISSVNKPITSNEMIIENMDISEVAKIKAMMWDCMVFMTPFCGYEIVTNWNFQTQKTPRLCKRAIEEF